MSQERKRPSDARVGGPFFLTRMVGGSAASNSIEDSFETIEGQTDHIVVPIAIDIDSQDGLQRVQISSLGLGDGAIRETTVSIPISAITVSVTATTLTFLASLTAI